MTNHIHLVPELTIRVVTGETCYAGEGGFSATYAEVAPDDASLVGQLSHARETGEVVTLRCAALDVTGRITNCRRKLTKKIFVLSIEDLTYRKV
jgi:hypothetical protein